MVIIIEKKHVLIKKEKHDIIKKMSDDSGKKIEAIVDDILSKALEVDNEEYF